MPDTTGFLRVCRRSCLIARIPGIKPLVWQKSDKKHYVNQDDFRNPGLNHGKKNSKAGKSGKKLKL
jgi:hypothetical protein